MKTRNIFLLLIIVMFTACDDSFLDRPLIDKIGSDTFGGSEEDLKLYANNFYTYISGHGTGFSNVGMARPDYNSDILTHRDAGFIRIAQGIQTIDDNFGWNFGFVRSLNFLLENYQNGNVDPAIQDRYAAEARFFRAWWYFDKVKAFGDYPWLDRTLDVDSEELTMARTPRTEAMDYVMEDLDFAINHLPSKSGYIIDDRISKEVALHLKARIALFEGTFRKYHGIAGDTKFLELARDAAKALIDGGHFVLNTAGSTPYQDLFVNLNLNGNKEIILGRVYNQSQEIGHAVVRYLPNGDLGLTRTAVDSYLCTDGKAISNSALYKGDEPGYSTGDEFIDRDPRMSQTVNPPGENYWQGSMPQLTTTGYSLLKFYRQDQDALISRGEIDAPVFRYAETLLIYAEAHAELGTATQTVLDASINLLRDRVGMPHLSTNPEADPNAEFPSLTSLLNEIRRERKVELMFEGYRRDDLLRWKAGSLLERPVRGMRFVAADYPTLTVGTDVVVDSDGFVDPYALHGHQANNFDENKHYYFPVPQEQISLNPNFAQNPGW